MASLDMKGPFELDKAKIDEQVKNFSRELRARAC